MQEQNKIALKCIFPQQQVFQSKKAMLKNKYTGRKYSHSTEKKIITDFPENINIGSKSIIISVLY